MHQKLAAALMTGVAMISSPGAACSGKLRNVYTVECRGADGALKWTEKLENLVTVEGANDALSKYLKGAAYTAAFYVGLYGGTGTLSTADTMASHAGWTESAAYSEANRQTLTLGTVAAGSVDNSAAKATFTMNAGATIKGAFVSTNNTKSGTTGVLYGVGAFSADRIVVASDQIIVTVTLSLS